MKRNVNKLILANTILLAGATSLYAGNFVTDDSVTAPESSGSKKVTGSLSLDANSHFISYGADVWGDGDDFGTYALNPSLGLNFDLGGGLSANIGTWWDVNGKQGNGNPLGGSIREVDVWGGLSYTKDIYTVSATYQEWYYNSDTEQILDIGFAVDAPFSPSLTIHNRLEQGGAPGDEGTILVLGFSHSQDFGPVSLSVPLNIAYFATDDYHKLGADTGIGYVSLGLQGSMPLSSLDSAMGGEWALNAGLTYYMTDDKIIPDNPEDSFLTSNFGLSLNF